MKKVEQEIDPDLTEQITIKNDYILIEPDEFDLLELICLIGNLLALPEFKSKPNIWILREEVKNLSYSDLLKLKEFSKKNFPESITHHKTAFVAESVYQRAMADAYRGISIEMPVKYKVFSSLEDAEEWVREGKNA